MGKFIVRLCFPMLIAALKYDYGTCFLNQTVLNCISKQYTCVSATHYASELLKFANTFHSAVRLKVRFISTTNILFCGTELAD